METETSASRSDQQHEQQSDARGKMAAINTETSLARAVSRSCARAEDEAYALIREALHASGDIIPGGTLTSRISLLSAPRRTRALAPICLVGAATEILAVCAAADDCRPRHLLVQRPLAVPSGCSPTR